MVDCEVGWIMGEDSLFCLVLVSKLIVSVVVLSLVDEGWLVFDELIVDWLLVFCLCLVDGCEVCIMLW